MRQVCQVAFFFIFYHFLTLYHLAGENTGQL
jgi:hypothetical protein